MPNYHSWPEPRFILKMEKIMLGPPRLLQFRYTVDNYLDYKHSVCMFEINIIRKRKILHVDVEKDLVLPVLRNKFKYKKSVMHEVELKNYLLTSQFLAKLFSINEF